MSNLSLDRLLDDKWLYEKNWIYYNSDVRLVEDVLHALKTLYGDRLGAVSLEECLSLEMNVLTECLLIDLRSATKDYPELLVPAFHELYERGINDLIEIRRDVLENEGEGN